MGREGATGLRASACCPRRPSAGRRCAGRACAAVRSASGARAAPRTPDCADGSRSSNSLRAARATASTCRITGNMRANSCAGLRWQERRRLRRRARSQVRYQTLDDPVESFVWHRLVLVTSAAKYNRIVAVRQLVEKPPDQRALADSRGAVNADGRRAALSDRGERRAQDGQFARTADKDWLQPVRLAATCLLMPNVTVDQLVEGLGA